MKAMTDKQQKGKEEVPSLPTPGLSDSTVKTHILTEKAGTSHLTARISELSIFGLLWA